MSDDRELVERLAAIDATPRADWVAELRADLDAAWETGDTDHLNSLSTATPTLVDPEPAPTQPTSRRWWPIVIAAAAVVLVVSALVLVTGDDDTRRRQVPAAPPPSPAAEHGLIAFSGSSGESRAESDTEIHVVAPDGTGLRALTSTPGVSEMAPRWSPDGRRLAFLRNGTNDGELVVIDPSTGDETFSAIIPNPPRSEVGPPQWSPDGRLIVFNVANSEHDVLAVDLKTGAWTPMSLGLFQGWSPDGRWFVLLRDDEPLLVPADLFGSTDLDDVSNLPGVRPLPGPIWLDSWMPDSSAVATGGDGSIDVVTIADGQRRTRIEDGAAPSWSPDGSHIAYLRCPDQPDPALPRDTVAADLAGVDPRQTDAAVWVAAADGTDARLVATSLEAPIWSADGSLLIAVGEDGLFIARPDGTGMTRLTRVMTPKKEGAFSGRTACSGVRFFAPVWQPIPPSAETVADAVLPDRVVTTEAAATTRPSATTEASATTDG